MLERHIEGQDIWQVQAAVKGGQCLLRDFAYQRSMQHIDVKVQDVELVDSAEDLVQHDHVIGHAAGLRRSAISEQRTNRTEVLESPLAKRVTSCPRRTSSSVK